MEVRPIRVVQYGLGAIGKDIARLVAQTPGVKLVGGIDNDPDLVGRDLGKVIGLDQELDMLISSNAGQVLDGAHPDVVILATTSRLHTAYPQLLDCLRARVNVVSTCEELVYPYAQNRELALQIDQMAQQSGITVVGVGVNPGFIMDLLPLVLTSPCIDVQRILITRVVDATIRRATLQHRVGIGLSQNDFKHHITKFGAAHVGLPESLRLITDRIGWQIERVEETIEPMITTEWVRGNNITVAPDHVMGIKQRAVGYVGGKEAIVLHWQTSVGDDQTYDAIQIDGVPPIKIQIDGGLHGDAAAAALVLHAIRPTLYATAGLRTVAELPPLHYTVNTRPQGA